jgi:hypothetical protein
VPFICLLTSALSSSEIRPSRRVSASISSRAVCRPHATVSRLLVDPKNSMARCSPRDRAHTRAATAGRDRPAAIVYAYDNGIVAPR